MKTRWFTTVLVLVGIASGITGIVLGLRQNKPSEVSTFWQSGSASGRSAAGAGFGGGSGFGGAARGGAGGGFSSAGGAGGTGGAPGSGGSARFAQMAQFREDHKFTFQLMSLTRGIQRLDGNTLDISPAQASSILKILQPLRDKDKLSQDDAKETIRAIQEVLTVEQRTMIAQLSERRGNRGQGGFGGGMGRQGGPGGMSGGPGSMGGQNRQGASGQRPQFDPAAMKDFNPFSRKQSATSSFGRRGNMNEFFDWLEEKSANTVQPTQ